MAIYDNLLRAADEAADQTAVELGGVGMDYATLADRMQRVAGGLRTHGVGPGDAVGLMLPNVPVFVSLAYGTFMNGSILVPLNVLLKPRELRHVIEDSALQVIITLADFVPVLEAACEGLTQPPRLIAASIDAQGQVDVPVLTAAAHGVAEALAPNQHVLTLYTSGTTGVPKGAKLSDRNLCEQVTMMGNCFPPRAGERGLCVLPLFHAFALNCLLNMAIRYRITVVLQPRFVVEDCLRALQEDDIAWFAGVPTMYSYLLRAAAAQGIDRLPALRHCLVGGAAMPTEVLTAFEQRFDVPIYEAYGLTETTVSVCCNRPGLHGRKPGSVGKPYAGVEMRVVDDAGRDVLHGTRGELLFRGANLMLGYLNQPEATAEVIRDGWFHTGDIGYVDRDGFCFLVDRKKDVIIKGGYNIYPREIEEVIHTLEAVAEVAVIGAPDALKGEQVVAFIAAKPGAAVREAQVRAHVADQLAKYKHPAVYCFVDALPKAPTGKILRRTVRDQWQSMAEGPVAAGVLTTFATPAASAAV